MSGFVSILDPPEEVPHLQALVDDIRDRPLQPAGGEVQGEAGRRGDVKAGSGAGSQGSRLGRQARGQVIRLHRREGGAEGLFGEAEEVAPGAEAPLPPQADPEVKRVPGAERDTRPPPLQPPPSEAQPSLFGAPALFGAQALFAAQAGAAGAKRFHVRRAVLAQDGHSSGEEMLYQSLWNCRYARPESKETRLVTIGWKAMAKLARLTPRNTRRNCQSLIDKLAVEQLSEENSRESIGRTYRLFSYKAILERRRAAGMEWVTRSRGVIFVPAPAGAAGAGSADAAAARREVPRPAGMAQGGDGGPPGAEIAPDAKRVPEAKGVPGAERDTGSSAQGSSEPVVRTLREYVPDVDDASVQALIEACRRHAPDATSEEINYFVRIKADLMYRMGTVKSPMGFLKTSVPRCFEGESFRQYPGG